MRGSLTPKQQRFVDEYLVDLDATAAAKRCGYSPKTATQSGYRLLQIPKVREALTAAREAQQQRTGITADRVLQEFARIGFFDIRKAVEWGGGEVRFIPSNVIDDDTAAAIQEVQADITQAIVGDGEDGPIMQTVKMKIKMASKVAALTKIAEHLGMLDASENRQPPTPPEPATYRGRDMSRRADDGD